VLDMYTWRSTAQRTADWYDAVLDRRTLERKGTP
jgi:hypothetical protein